ncbi:ankyrin-3 [Syngnathus scovelli]|uniref:ankyrin-3 n=1 Tax=Syngnathus scovelli TaxID=161590 RepID=UPI0035CC8DCB
MAHAAAHIKKARSEMDPPADLKALEKAKERRRRSREQAERRRKSDSNTSFLRAARAGNIDKVLEYLKGGVDINTSNQNGLNALHLAAKEGHVALVEELLEGGVALNSATKKGNTALHISALAGQAEVVKVLVKRGADINGQSQNGFTPLYMAAQENHLDVVRYLLENGGNQSAATEDGFTPLAIALQQGHERVVSVLLENDTKGKVRLPALHIAARKDDTKSAALLLQSDHNADVRSKMMVNRSTESGFTPLHIAAHYGNVNVATLLLNRGAAVDFLARNAITPLHVASKRGNGAMVCLLLDRGSQIDAKTRDGLTPLHCAARSGHDSAVELLLERGAPLLARTKNGLSPLHMAAQGDHVDCVKQLLRHSAPIGDVTLDYLTALHVAAHCGHFRVTQLLLERRADPDARALNGFTPLHIACKKNRVKVMELLVKYGASVQAVTESGLTPVHVAAFMGHLNIVLLLLQNGASPDRSNIRGETSLHMAVRAGQVEVVRCLLRNGATVDARAREEQTPLHIASRLGKSEIVQLLLQHMAHPDAATANGYTALHIAAKEGQPEIASVLLEAGAERSLPTKKGFTPLHVASKYGSRDVAKLLLQRGALPDSVGKNGLTPLHVATHYDNQKVALLLLDKGASPHAVAKNGYTPLHIAAKKNQVETARALLACGAQSHLLSKQGVTPLHLASEEGHADMAALLLNHGARVNAGTKSGLSALHLAAQDDRLAAAQILATNGADLDQQTKLGYTPLMVACHYGNSKVVNFLLQNGASVTVETKNGYGPLHQAAQQGNTHIIDILLQHGAKPNAVTANGNTALGIARRLGYISVVDTLKVVTEEMVTTTTTTTVTEKHKLNVPETMTEVLDVSDEEGDDTITGDGGDYLRAEDLRELGDDSLPGQYPDHANYFGDEGAHAGSWESSFTLQSYQQKLESVTDERLTCQTWWLSRGKVQNSYRLSWGAENLDNLAPHSGPGSPCRDGASDLSSFLVSFMVDARGGSMRGCRHHGLRVLIPPGTCGAPTRVTCRLVKRQRLAQGPALAARRGAELAVSAGQLLGKLHLPSAPPPLNEGESLVSRMVQLGPPGTTFLGPVVVEVPHFAALRGGERELVILRSETGESWKEHHCEHTQEELKQILNTADDEEPDSGEEVQKKRICRIIARDLPQFFAVVSRVRQDAALIGPEGGVLSSTVVPQVQARFPEGALTKKIRVGLQAQPVSLDLVRRALGNRSSFSPVVTLEPRRRKFHKAITVTIPVPKGNALPLPAASSRSAPTLRLLCSITGGTTPAQWEDITGTTPLTFTSDRVSFTTNVSARFWLIDCRQVHESVNFSSRVYRELICVPYMAKFVILAKSHHEPSEGHLRCLCVTDDKLDKTPEQRDDFTEVARSRDVEVLEGRPIYADCCGNFVPLAKSGQHHLFSFFAFKENRLALSIKIRDDAREPCGRLCFLKEPPRSYGAALGHDAVCNLNVALPSFRKESDSDPEEEMDNARREQREETAAALSRVELTREADLLSDVSEMKGDLMKMTAILTARPSEERRPALGGHTSQKGLPDLSRVPLEIMEKDLEKVKEDLEKVSQILRSGTYRQASRDPELLLSDAAIGEAAERPAHGGADASAEDTGESRLAASRAKDGCGANRLPVGSVKDKVKSLQQRAGAAEQSGNGDEPSPPLRGTAKTPPAPKDGHPRTAAPPAGSGKCQDSLSVKELMRAFQKDPSSTPSGLYGRPPTSPWTTSIPLDSKAAPLDEVDRKKSAPEGDGEDRGAPANWVTSSSSDDTSPQSLHLDQQTPPPGAVREKPSTRHGEERASPSIEPPSSHLTAAQPFGEADARSGSNSLKSGAAPEDLSESARQLGGGSGHLQSGLPSARSQTCIDERRASLRLPTTQDCRPLSPSSADDDSLTISHRDSLEGSPVLDRNSSSLQSPDSIEASPCEQEEEEEEEEEWPPRDSLESSPVEWPALPLMGDHPASQSEPSHRAFGHFPQPQARADRDRVHTSSAAAHHRSQAKDVRQTTAPIGPEEAHTNSSKVQEPVAMPPPPLPVAAATDDGPSARLNAANRSHEQKAVKSGETAPFPPNVTDRAEAAPEVPTCQTSKPPEFRSYDHAEEEELDCPRTESKGVTAKMECCAFGKVEEVEILNLAVPVAAAGSPSLAAAGSPSLAAAGSPSLATAGSSSLPGTADTTPEEKTPTEESTPTSEPNPFLFQEGKLFEMTRSGAIDMTKRSCQEDGGAFAFFQIAQHALEGPVSGNSGREGEAPASWRDVGLNLKVELKTEERSEQNPDWQLPSITEIDHTSAKLKIPKMGLSTCWAKDHRDPESLEAPAHHGDSSCLDLASTGHATVNAETAESTLTRLERGTESSHSSRQDSKSAADPPDSCGVPPKSPSEPARPVQKQTPAGAKSRIPIKSKSPEADSLLRSAQDKRSRGPTNGTAAPSQGTLVKAKTSAGTAWTGPESKAKAFRSRLPVKGKGDPSRKDAGEARRHSEPSLVEVAERPEEDRRRRRRRDQSTTERHASGSGRRRRSCAGETQARPSPGAADGPFVEKESESHRTDTVDAMESGAGASAASPEPKGHNEMEATRGGAAESTRSEQAALAAVAAVAAGALTPRLPRPTTHAGVPHQKPGA